MATKVPAFSTNCSYSTEIKNGYWYIYLKSSGNFTMTYNKTVEVCVVGGGAGGRVYATHHDLGEHGGGGGTVVNKTGVSITGGTSYPIVVGNGGELSYWVSTGGWHSEGGEGGTSSAFGFSASGGQTGLGNAGLSQKGKNATAGGDGTYAFGDTSLSRYGGGGGGGGEDWWAPGAGGAGGGGKGAGGHGNYSHAVAGTANTGGGGGGAGEGGNGDGGNAAKGGSGVVIIRGTQDDNIPIVYNGTQLQEIYFNGTKITSLYYNGTKVF